MRAHPQNFIKADTNFFLKDTHIENLFISEYMAHAKGEYVKVFLFARMYADSDEPMSNEMIARHFSMKAEEVLMAWTYWEEQGVIRKHYHSPDSTLDYAVEFINLKEMMFQGAAAQKTKHPSYIIPDEVKHVLANDQIKKMYSTIEKIAGRTLESKELTDILSWVEEDGMKPALIIKTYEYSVERKGNNKYKYVASLIKLWREKEINDTAQMEKYLEDTDQRHYQYKRILKALGMHRYATEEEKRIMDTWLDEMNFTLDVILDACKKTSGISNPNINYVNSILKNWYAEKTGTTKLNTFGVSGKPARKNTSSIIKTYEAIREKNQEILKQRKEEIHKKVPRILAIETETSDLSIQISKLMLSKKSGKEQEVEFIKQKINGLSAEKAYLLTDNGFAHDYLEPIYECKDCKDTGDLDSGGRCHCFAQKLKESES